MTSNIQVLQLHALSRRQNLMKSSFSRIFVDEDYCVLCLILVEKSPQIERFPLFFISNFLIIFRVVFLYLAFFCGI